MPRRRAPPGRPPFGALTLDGAGTLRAAGVPTEPRYAKAAEGVLKGADDARIGVAVRTLACELEQARAARLRHTAAPLAPPP